MLWFTIYDYQFLIFKQFTVRVKDVHILWEITAL